MPTQRRQQPQLTMAACAAWALNSASLAFSSACFVCSCVLICSKTCGAETGPQQEGEEGQNTCARLSGRRRAGGGGSGGAPSWRTASSEFRAVPWHHAPGPRDRSTCRRQRRGPRQCPSRRRPGPGRQPWQQQCVPSSWLQVRARRRWVSQRVPKGRRCGLPAAGMGPARLQDGAGFGFRPGVTAPQVPTGVANAGCPFLEAIAPDRHLITGLRRIREAGQHCQRAGRRAGLLPLLAAAATACRAWRWLLCA